MSTQDAAWLALGGCTIFFLLAFGLRSLLQYRRTGSTGFVGISGRPGSLEWCGGVLFVVALAAGVGAPILQLAGSLTAHPAFDHAAAQALGILLYGLGVAGTLWAQLAMGDSWRIGVDAGARTALVSSGPFRWVRNPIYSAMLAALLGVALLVPNVMSVIALGALIIALEVQVRLLEEPYLTRVHGGDYRSYAARTGRFLPAVGRLSPRKQRPLSETRMDGPLKSS